MDIDTFSTKDSADYDYNTTVFLQELTNWSIFRLLGSLSRLEAINLKTSINLNSYFTFISFPFLLTNLSTMTCFVKEI